MNDDSCPLVYVSQKIETLLMSTNNEEFKGQLLSSLKVIDECFRLYNSEDIYLCFNGGKDCIVTLHLLFAYCQSHGVRLQGLFIKNFSAFPEMNVFVAETSKAYNLNLISYEGSLKEALIQFTKEFPNVKAMVMGTRKNDPSGKELENFSLTSEDWPSLMRVSPILNWDYSHIWTFIRELNLKYPHFYDEGYTSLGNVESTFKNEALRYVDENGVVKYRPAYCLKDSSLERSGRNNVDYEINK